MKNKHKSTVFYTHKLYRIVLNITKLLFKMEALGCSNWDCDSCEVRKFVVLSDKQFCTRILKPRKNHLRI